MPDKREKLARITLAKCIEMHIKAKADGHPPMVVIVCDLTDDYGRAVASWNEQYGETETKQFDTWSFALRVDEWNRRCPNQAIAATDHNPVVVVSGNDPLMIDIVRADVHVVNGTTRNEFVMRKMLDDKPGSGGMLLTSRPS